ncbi:MAG TPA: hypothetical protein VFK50_05945 [Sphingomicrobium sp.]|nr:hypothetical protein [Sphingomicrobium sp.]
MNLRLSSLIALSLLAGCSREGLFESGGVYTTRSACPQVGIVGATGDITLFNPPASTSAAAIDVTATITNVRSTCQEAGDQIISTATFDVVGQRRDAGPARQVVLPFFDVAMQGGTTIAAKRVGNVGLTFEAGSQRAQTSGQATIRVSKAAATIPNDIERLLTVRRKPGDPQAAVDPLTDPVVRAAVQRATFEHLIGFQLTDAQLRYNATR